MRSVTYSMNMSLDGFIVGPDGSFDWGVPDEEVFDFVTEAIQEVGVHLLGRRLYETMLYWETADQDPDGSMRHVLRWAGIWNAIPKVVFSNTLSTVKGNARLASGDLAQEIERLRAESGPGDIAIGGATLAAEAASLGLIDEYRISGLSGAARWWHSVLRPLMNSGCTSSSSRPACSPRRSSTSGTAWRASRFASSPLTIVQAWPDALDDERGLPTVGPRQQMRRT